MRAFIWALSAMLLAGCGGGGGGGGDGEAPSSIAAPSGLSYPSPPSFEVSRQITPLNPSVTGAVTSYSVSPALPTGLALDATTGRLSGTPTAAAATAVYTVTASNSSGSTATGISVTVNDIAPSIRYPSVSYSLATGVPVTPIAPTRTGGAPLSWSISQPLPAGLTFSSTDGSITGTPTATSTATDYAITAENSAGSDMFAISIEVTSGVLLELGHFNEIVSIRRAGNRILSTDEGGHWVLWNASNAAMIAQGESSCSQPCDNVVEIAGSTVLSKLGMQLQVLDTADGRVLATVDTAAGWATLASDGSYIAAGTESEVRAWNRSGAALFTRSGNYRYAQPFAAPTEVRIGRGPAGADRVEKISVSTGASTTVPHGGQFHSWFADSNRFFTHVSNTVWVYDTDGAELDLRVLASVENLTGQGDWFWTARDSSPYLLEIYEVGASATPTTSYSFPSNYEAVASANTIGVLNSAASGTEQISIIDLSGATPVKVDHPTSLNRPRAYGAISNTQWFTGNQYGVLAQEDMTPGTPTYFSWGAVRSIAASTQHIAVATASRRIVYFDAATREQEGVIDFHAGDVQLSEDGSVLGAQGDGEQDQGLRFYSLPSENVLLIQPQPVTFSLASSGAVFSRTHSLVYNQPYTREVIRMSDEAVLWTDTIARSIEDPLPLLARVSPDGSAVAASDGGRRANTGTNIYVDLDVQVNGTLRTAVPGWAVGWFDDDRLLVSQFIVTRAPYHEYAGTVVVDLSSGQQSVRLPFPNMTRFQPMTLERVYSPERNVIVSLSDGSTLWQSATPTFGKGGVTLTHVIFAWGATVRAESY